MRLRPALLAAAATITLGAMPSLADIVVPEIEDCRDKKVGDACPGGTCQSDGFSCQAGSCRRFDDEASCKADGCRWVEGISCRASAASLPSTPATPTPPTTTTTTTPSGAGSTPVPVPGGCAASGGDGVFGLAGLLVGAAALVRRRRSRG